MPVLRVEKVRYSVRESHDVIVKKAWTATACVLIPYRRCSRQQKRALTSATAAMLHLFQASFT
ncbi:hypothetical protein AX760_04995 [Pararhizobium antarcticum]|uniref:Uncharacterized protein n=1 Tax=Pararhizobium antarcticum TaxID=1798805 RepID=A0A657LSZ0_9HYPH|nr:hypothetical protein AX760_04995 [Pararhizobium antarcticum]OJF95999.1 hypothetical protein AX761_16690 [Rhizobium sp. 58]